jgi:hypothetical protein
MRHAQSYRHYLWQVSSISFYIYGLKNPPQSLRRQTKGFVEAERLRPYQRYTRRTLKEVKFN